MRCRSSSMLKCIRWRIRGLELTKRCDREPRLSFPALGVEPHDSEERWGNKRWRGNLDAWSWTCQSAVSGFSLAHTLVCIHIPSLSPPFSLFTKKMCLVLINEESMDVWKPWGSCADLSSGKQVSVNRVRLESPVLPRGCPAAWMRCSKLHFPFYE